MIYQMIPITSRSGINPRYLQLTDCPKTVQGGTRASCRYSKSCLCQPDIPISCSPFILFFSWKFHSHSHSHFHWTLHFFCTSSEYGRVKPIKAKGHKCIGRKLLGEKTCFWKLPLSLSLAVLFLTCSSLAHSIRHGFQLHDSCNTSVWDQGWSNANRQS